MSKRAYEKRLARKREQERLQRRRQRRMRMIRQWGIGIGAVVVVALLVVFLGPGKKTKTTATPSPTASPSSSGVPCVGPTPPAAAPKTYKAFPATVTKNNKKYLLTMETSCGTIRMTLDPKIAPKAVNNIVFLAKEGFYNGLAFHRIEKNAPFQLVQGGDPKGDGSGGPGYEFVIEKPPAASATSPYIRPVPGSATPSPAETPAQVLYLSGVVAMANSGGTATNGSQFFIDVSDVQLAPNYTVLGKVDAASMAVLQKMIAVPLGGPTKTAPDPSVFIIKVTVKEVAA